MTDHPEFPQESPAMRYIVDQVSKIEDAHACSSGYYHSLGKVLARLDKTDTALVQLQQVTGNLKRVTDSNVVATVIGKKSDEINKTLREGMDAILVENVKTVSSCLTGIRYDNAQAASRLHFLIGEMHDTNAKLDSQISTVNSCLVIPAWKAWLYALLLALGGVLLGRFL